ncbi:MAG: LCP family protein [bacterium]|nr:LCP family protein [bacterium]
MLQLLTKKKILFVGFGAVLVVLVFALSILVYFVFGYNPRDRINFVLLGEGGLGHAGSTLTDSTIFASVGKEGTMLVSVPRDLWYEPWQTKINSIYYYGEEKGDGLEWNKKIIGEIVGQRIDHTVLIDFTVFRDLVDLVGGVEIKVDRTFEDPHYPIAGLENDLCDGDPEYKCRYELIRFETGPLHLNGEQALKFVRSRYAEGEEGTDTARSARQQKVIVSLKEKLISPEIFLSMEKIKSLKRIFETRIKSDLSRDDLILLGRILLSTNARQFESFVINGWQEERGLIYHPLKHSSGQWVLLPRDDSWSGIHDFINCLILEENKSSCFPLKKPETPKT